MRKISIFAGFGIIVLSVILILVGKYYTNGDSYTEITVSGSDPWTRTGIILKEGDVVHIKAKGKIRWDDNTIAPIIDPEGASWTPKEVLEKDSIKKREFIFPNSPMGMLLATIAKDILDYGDETRGFPHPNSCILYTVGRERKIEVDEGGELLLGINLEQIPWMYRGDNIAERITKVINDWDRRSGSYTVKVKIVERISDDTLLPSVYNKPSHVIFLNPLNIWKLTKIHISKDCFLSIKVRVIFTGKDGEVVYLHNNPEYKNLELFLCYRIGKTGKVHVITSKNSIVDLHEERPLFDEVGQLYLFVKDPNKKRHDNLKWRITIKGRPATKSDIDEFRKTQNAIIESETEIYKKKRIAETAGKDFTRSGNTDQVAIPYEDKWYVQHFWYVPAGSILKLELMKMEYADGSPVHYGLAKRSEYADFWFWCKVGEKNQSFKVSFDKAQFTKKITDGGMLYFRKSEAVLDESSNNIHYSIRASYIDFIKMP